MVAHTHYLPRHWRGRAHTQEVQASFQALFQFKALLFLEEMASILLTPFVLYFSLPACAGAARRHPRSPSPPEAPCPSCLSEPLNPRTLWWRLASHGA